MNKDNAIEEFWESTKKSWTWERLTQEEQKRFINCVSHAVLRGTFQQRHQHLHDMYYAFLIGLGYSWENWRE